MQIARRPSPFRGSFPSARKALAAMTMALAAHAAQAANPNDWWVYLANDYADDIKDVLAQGADPNVRFQNGQPALMRAVVAGAWNVFDAIAADRRTDVNAENPAGETPLMYLAIAGQTERARALIARGAQVNRLGWTPLHYAASKGQLAMAQLLLQHKAMVNAPGPSGETPLMMAALSGSKPMVELLLKAGADVTTRDTKGQNAADWATTGKSTKLAAELRELIARQDRDKQARRAAAPAEIEPEGEGEAQLGMAPGQGGQTAQPVPATDAPPALAPTGQAQQPVAPGGAGAPAVRGVSGVQLNSYE